MKLTRTLTQSALFVLLVAANARAEASSQDRATASRLFDDAGRLMASGHANEACPKYAESERLDPELGTLLHLGECYAKVGKSASAWASFRDASEIAHNRADPREAKIRERVAKLETSLSNLVIAVADPSPEIEVRQDGALVGRAVWGSPVPVDPGAHTITAAAPGKKPWTAPVEVAGNAAAVRVEVPVLEAAPAAASAPPAAAPAPKTPEPSGAATASHALAPATDSKFLGLSTQSLAGWSMIGVGAIGVGVGVVFTLQRSSALDARNAVCPTGVCPQAELDVDRAAIASHTSDARSDGTIAMVGYIAGGVLAAGGVVLLLTDHHRSSDVGLTPLVSPGFAGLTLGGRL